MAQAADARLSRAEVLRRRLVAQSATDGDASSTPRGPSARTVRAQQPNPICPDFHVAANAPYASSNERPTGDGNPKSLRSPADPALLPCLLRRDYEQFRAVYLQRQAPEACCIRRLLCSGQRTTSSCLSSPACAARARASHGCLACARSWAVSGVSAGHIPHTHGSLSAWRLSCGQARRGCVLHAHAL